MSRKVEKTSKSIIDNESRVSYTQRKKKSQISKRGVCAGGLTWEIQYECVSMLTYMES